MHITTDEGREPIETSNSGANQALSMHAQNDRCGLGTHTDL